MRLTVATRLVFCLLALAGLALPEVAAAQCFEECVNVGPFCFQCETQDEETGNLCHNITPCRCVYDPCILVKAEQDQVQATLTELGLGAPNVVPTSCLSAASAETAPPLLAPAN